MDNLTIQNITKLYLKTDKEYPITSVRISKAVNMMPVCTVTVSCGSFVNDDGSLVTAEFPEMDEQAEVIIEIDDNELVLFGGYISTEVTNTVSSSQAFEGYKAFRIASATEFLDCIPPASLSYLDCRAGGLSTIQQGYTVYNEASANIKNALANQQALDKHRNVSDLILIAAQQANDAYSTDPGDKLKISDCIGADYIRFSDALHITSAFTQISEVLTCYAMRGLNYYQLVFQTCTDLGLSLIPISRNVNKRVVDMMCIKNRVAWCEDPDNIVKIGLSDYIGISSSYSSVANKRVDGVIIPLSDDIQSITDSSGFILYGEGYGESGKPVIITSDTLTKKVVKLKCKLIQVPGWLKGCIRDTDFTTIASKKAVTEFANHAHQQSTAMLNIPLGTSIALANDLGKTVELTVIKDEKLQEQKNHSSNTSKIYGRLQSLELAVVLTNNKLNVNCTCNLSHVVTEDVFNKYKVSKKQLLFN